MRSYCWLSGFVLLSLFCQGCSSNSQEKALIQALEKEINFNNSQVKQSYLPWLAWQSKNPSCYWHPSDKKVWANLQASTEIIYSLVLKAEFIEKKLQHRYLPIASSDNIKLSDKEEKELLDVKRSLARSITLLRNDYQYEETYLDTASAQSLLPVWFSNRTSENWLDTYFRNQHVYPVVLQLKLLQSYLYNLLSLLKYDALTKIGGYTSDGNIFYLYRSFKDTIQATEVGRGMVYLGTYGSGFRCGTAVFPKAFLLNGKKMPIHNDLLLREPMVKVALPTSISDLQRKNVTEKKWSGHWIITLSEYKDTVIQMKGTYLLQK